MPLLLGHLRHGQFRWHPTEYILASLERARPVTNQLGFVATAVGDHPDIEQILREANQLGFRTSVSSIRIPAVTEGVLDALHASGDRSITLAPETGTDELRVKMGKPIPNAFLLEKIRLIFRHGFTQLKLYFIVGLPGETMEDVQGILELAARARAIMLEELAKKGIIGHIHLGVNVLVPKPYTPWQREPMDDERSLKEKLALLKKRRRADAQRLAGLGLDPRRRSGRPTSARPAATPPTPSSRRPRRAPLRPPPPLRDRRSTRRSSAPSKGDLRWHFMRQGL